MSKLGTTYHVPWLLFTLLDITGDWSSAMVFISCLDDGSAI